MRSRKNQPTGSERRRGISTLSVIACKKLRNNMKQYTFRDERTGEKLTMTESSGNVFADLGLPNAEEEHTKGRLAVMLLNIFDALDVSQKELAKRLGTDQPKISALKHNKLDGFSVQRLLE